jgi:hypothetical protein
MAWTTFPTLTDGQILTGAHMQLVRDNFAETAPAKATTAGRIFVATGTNAVAERAILNNVVTTIETTSTTTYTDLATGGPAVTLTTGTQALAFLSVRLQNQVAGAQALASVAVSSASTVAASDNDCVRTLSDAINSMIRATVCIHFTGTSALTAGSNVFTAKYRVSASTGTFAERSLTVIGL